MIIKNNLFFSANLPNGGRKTVSYKRLLDNPDILEIPIPEVEGEPGLVSDGPEKGFSLNSLLIRYHSALLGKTLSDCFPKDLPLRFHFRTPDLNSMEISAQNEICRFSSVSRVISIDGGTEIDLRNRTFPVILCSAGECCIGTSDEIATIKAGEMLVISPGVYQLTGNQDCTLLQFE